jgi:hypothetical protein
MDKFESFFDRQQFALAFGAATRDTPSIPKKCQPTALRKGESSSPPAGSSWSDRKRVLKGLRDLRPEHDRNDGLAAPRTRRSSTDGWS